MPQTGPAQRALSPQAGVIPRDDFQPPGNRAPGLVNLDVNSPEARLLLACLSHPLGAQGGFVEDLWLERIDWTTVMRWAARHRVRPLLYSGLRAGGVRRVPELVLAELAAFGHANARRSLYLSAELIRLLAAYGAAGIEVVPFKGPVLAAQLHGNPALREAGDLDLLVHRRDIECARRLLIEQGHRPMFPTATARESAWLAALSGPRQMEYLLSHSEHHLLREQGLLNVDLHWALAVRDFHLKLDEQTLWSWLAPQAFGGQRIRSFAPEELLLVLCINGAKDCWERLDRITDVAALLRRHPELDWRQFMDRAASIGAARMLCVGVALAGQLLKAPLPQGIERAIHLDAHVARLVNKIQDKLFCPQASAAESSSLGRSFLHIRLRERVSDRIGYCAAHLSPGVGDWAALPLPRALRFLHYGTRPLRLIARYARSES